MPDNHPRSKSYRINNVLVNSQLNTIENNGDIVRVEPKAMQLLNFLVRHQGEVCSKQAILDEIWPRQEVADDIVTRLIFVLRSALGDDAKSPKFISTVPKKGYVFLAKVTQENQRGFPIVALGTVGVVLIGLWLIWLNFSSSNNATFYNIERSIPVTHQEGREYSFAMGDDFSAYFHEEDELTSLVVFENGEKKSVLNQNNWRKRSLLIVNSALFYIRFTESRYQIIQQSLTTEPEVLFESEAPLYTLSFDKQRQRLLFNHYLNNNRTLLYSYSFVSGQVSPVDLSQVQVPNQVYSHIFDNANETLFFVGIDSKKPTIYGFKHGEEAYEYQISGFEKINSLALSKSKNELLVAGTHNFSQGIWSVSLTAQTKSQVFSHPDKDITQVVYNEVENALYYTFQGQRLDIELIDLLGESYELEGLNSTLIEKGARFSANGEQVHFVSNRSGDFELYAYQRNTKRTQQLTKLNASTIWYYSFSNDLSKIAIVYSTEHIRLGVIDVKTGNLIESIAMEEIKFPLGWSKDDKHIYISEHLSNIAMYMYDAETLAIQKQRTHIGLTAFELSPGEVLAFDYQTESFVAYDFNTEQLQVVSLPVREQMSLTPFNSSTNGKIAMIVYQNGLQNDVYRISISADKEQQGELLEGNWQGSGKVQDIAPDMSTFLVSDSKQISSGNIVSLKLN